MHLTKASTLSLLLIALLDLALLTPAPGQYCGANGSPSCVPLPFVPTWFIGNVDINPNYGDPAYPIPGFRATTGCSANSGGYQQVTGGKFVAGGLTFIHADVLSTSNVGMRAWVDWNRDNYFDNSTEAYQMNFVPTPGNPFGPAAYEVGINLPAGSSLGQSRMRLRYGGAGVPCGGGGYEVEDYIIQIVPRPANDTCGSASVIQSYASGSIEYGTMDAPQSCVPSWRDVWFKHTPTCTTSITASLCSSDGGSSGFDSTIKVYSGTCNNLQLIACGDNQCGNGARVTFPAVAGNAYFICVGQYPNASISNPNYQLVLLKSLASSTPFGSGCGNPVPSLTSTIPILGSTAVLTVNAPNGSIGFLLVGTGGAPLPISAGCNLLLQNPLVVLTSFVVFAGDSWSISGTVPADPAFAGITVDFQVLMAQPNGLATTNALHLVIGC